MNKWKRIGLALLYPPIALRLFLIPLSVVLLVWSMAYLGSETVPAYISYVLSAYTLTVWCLQIPNLVAFFRAFGQQNKLAVRWKNDVRLRINISLYGSLIRNAAYAILQLGLGIYHGSFWFYSMAAYYILLSFMRLYLAGYTVRHKPGEQMLAELRRYRVCGWVFLLMNLALTLIIFFMVYWNRTFHHHQITTIALAAYTFTALTVAIVNVVKYRKYNSPVFSASRAISLAAASVSMLTLTSTMLTSFGSDGEESFRRGMLGGLGTAVSLFVIVMAIYMIRRGGREIRKIKHEVPNEPK